MIYRKWAILVIDGQIKRERETERESRKYVLSGMHDFEDGNPWN